MIRRFEMRNMLVFFAILLFVPGHRTVLAQSKTNYRAFSPSDAGRSVMLKSDSRTYKYFELDEGKVIGFEVTGPTRIKIRSRALLPEKISAAEYDITVWEDDRVRAGRKADTKPSKLTISGERGAVGVARDIIFNVPKGKHKYAISAQSDKVDRVYLRFHQARKQKPKQTYHNFRPYEYGKRVNLRSGKSNLSYYLADGGAGPALRVIGPTSIKIYCRANFDPTMKEKAKFTLGAMEKGEAVRKFSAVADKSSKSIYTDLPGIIPSKVHTFTLEVPDGEHVYEFRKINSTPDGLAVRFKILKSSLGKKK